MAQRMRLILGATSLRTCTCVPCPDLLRGLQLGNFWLQKRSVLTVMLQLMELFIET